MLITHYTVKIRSTSSLQENKLLPALKDIYGCPGKNFDGYVSRVIQEKDSFLIQCYTLEGPEEVERLSSVKQSCDNWSDYRKNAVLNAITRYLDISGYKWISCEILGPV
jgi:hypothetical protein